MAKRSNPGELWEPLIFRGGVLLTCFKMHLHTQENLRGRLQRFLSWTSLCLPGEELSFISIKWLSILVIVVHFMSLELLTFLPVQRIPCYIGVGKNIRDKAMIIIVITMNNNIFINSWLEIFLLFWCSLSHTYSYWGDVRGGFSNQWDKEG